MKSSSSDSSSPFDGVQADGAPADGPADIPATAAEAAADVSVNAQLADQRDRYLRLAAEYDNYRKRVAREQKETWSRAQAELVRSFVEALDDLARFAHVDPASADVGTVVQGVELVERKMLKTLNGLGLQIVNPLDQTFDPAMHEAVSTVPAMSKEDDHTVAQVFQPGYVFNGQLLRPARVVVKQWNR